MPLIDIFVPTYEPKPAHLCAAIDSILKQTEQRFSVIIHDDGSPRTDVEAIVKPYLSDPRIRFVKGAHRGIGGNWNASVRLGTAPYMQFLFQDDTWEPDYLKSCLEVLENDADVGFVAAAHRYDDGQGNPVPADSSYAAVHAERALLGGGRHNGRKFLRAWAEHGLHPNLIGEPSFVLMRRSVAERAGPFREDLTQLLDAEYWGRMLLLADWYFLPQSLGMFRVHAAGASAVHEKHGEGLFERLTVLGEILPRLTPEERRPLARSMSTQIAGMIGKYRNRKAEGKSIGGGGKSAFIKFSLQHPLIVSRGLRQYLSQGTRNS